MSRIISTGLAKTGLLLGYKVARDTGNRRAGSAILAACGLLPSRFGKTTQARAGLSLSRARILRLLARPTPWRRKSARGRQ